MNTYGGIAKPAAAGILILFCLYLALYHALFGALVALLRRNLSSSNRALVLSPFVWVAVELARARITGFPWDILGIAQVDNAFLTRLAPYAGAYGLSFVIAAVNAAWLSRITLKKRRYTHPVLIAIGAGVLLLYVAFVRQRSLLLQEGDPGNAILVQQNLEVGAPAGRSGAPLSKNQMLLAFSQLSLFPPTADACDGIPEVSSTHCGNSTSTSYLATTDLIVWPEAPNSFYESDPEFRQAMAKLARTARAPLIIGNIGMDPDHNTQRGYDLYNSAEFIRPDGTIAGRFDKMHLVPFGEYVPYKNLFFFAGSLLADVGEFDPGKQRSVFTTGGHTYGTFICYESIFADEIRHYERNGAEVLVNISDDGWYGDTSAPWEHLNMVRMRAIENHRWILRATNTGVTAAVDPAGHVTAAAPRHERTSLHVNFSYEHSVTFYAAHGDLFAYLCALITAISLACAFVQARRQPRPAAIPSTHALSS